jgi:predicted nucleic acid-binding protein
VDASAGIKVVVSEEHSEKALRLFSYLAEDPPIRIFVPDLFFPECANILWKHVRRLGLAPDSARQKVADLAALAVIAVPARDLAEDALELALRLDITAYDASYVALSERLGLPLVTADDALVRKLTGLGYEVQSLAALPGP